jgi:tRNA modification GTPase
LPRKASYVRLYDPATGGLIDHALTFWFPGPASATGEDVAELHLHGGRAVVAATLAALGALAHLRAAEAGEFTRRAFENGRIDLAEAEGLADLLAAETESQRQAALVLSEGGLGKTVSEWQHQLMRIAATVESELDFADESDVRENISRALDLDMLAGALRALLATPPAERLKDGLRVVIAGPPNAGKSSLFNRLIDREAAIVAEVAGTTRDRIEANVAIGGFPLILIDTAGLRDKTDDRIEEMGMARTAEALQQADVIIWLGPPDEAPASALIVAAKADLDVSTLGTTGLPVSVVTGEGVTALRDAILARARALLPRPGALALNQRHRSLIAVVLEEIGEASSQTDLLLVAEHLRRAGAALDRITGKAGVEDMLDALFGQFCIGK